MSADRVIAQAVTITVPQDAGVNAWLLRAPWWKLAFVMGALIAPFFVLMFGLTGDQSWTAALLMGLGVGVVCGPVLGYITASHVQDSMAASGSLSEGDRAVAERAARRGPVPEDDVVREAALGVVEDRLLVLRETRVQARVTAAILLVVAVLLAVTRSHWWWIAVVFCVGLVVLVLVAPVRLQRRAELLDRGVR
jgi:MFS family permease